MTDGVAVLLWRAAREPSNLAWGDEGAPRLRDDAPPSVVPRPRSDIATNVLAAGQCRWNTWLSRPSSFANLAANSSAGGRRGAISLMVDIGRLNAALEGRYRIERELGAGGMATVYLAHDIRHDRKVALKVLKPELAAVLGADRFVQEIRTTASLQHPHILALFDSGTADGFLFYVMPYIEGETLRDRLNRETQLGVADAVRMAREIADALDYAHRHGIIHRDIKPENILLHDSRPMVADFGIALAVSAAAGGRMTETGTSIGTPHYMSPEQATADKELTGRADIYSLASVLYEMLTGDPPHTGSSAQQVIMKIIADVPRPVTELRKSVPPNVAAALSQALEKLPADRFESAKAFADALGDATFTRLGSYATVAGPTASARYWIAAAAVVALTTGWFVGRSSVRSDRVATPVTRFTVPVPTGYQMTEQEAADLALSPDGQTLVYVTAGMLYRRHLGSENSEPLPGTRGAFLPFFSADGEWIAFTQANVIRKMAIGGGPITDVVVPGSTFGSTWGEDGTIVYSTRGALWHIPESGGVPKLVTELGPGEVEHAWPQLIDGGRVLIYTVMGNTGLWADARVVVLDRETRKQTVVREQATYGRYVPPGYIVYTDASGTISAVPFDLKARATTGVPFSVESGVLVANWGGGASFAVSGNGTLVFPRGSSFNDFLLWWVDRGGVRQQLGGPTGVWDTNLSPDGRRILSARPQPTGIDVWTIDAASGEYDRVTFAEPGVAIHETPIWSRDGRRIAYTSPIGDSTRILVQDFPRSAGASEVRTGRFHRHLLDWSPNGEWLLIEVDHPETGSDLHALRVDGDEELVIAATPATEMGVTFSPDGRWLAYESNASGRPEVYVVSFPELTARRQVSTDGGVLPRWSPVGNELFYWQDSTLVATRVSTAGEFQRGPTTRLFTMPDVDVFQGRWAVSPDARRFLVTTKNPEAPAREIHIVLNWHRVLESAHRRDRSP